MIQDIAPRNLKNPFVNYTVEEKDTVIVINQNRLLLKENEESVAFTIYGELAKQLAPEKCIYLFSVDKERYFLTMEEGIEVTEYEWKTIYEIRGFEPKEKIFVAATAWHLAVWYRANRFCGSCGEKTSHDEKLRMLQCKKCGNQIFPKIAPAVIVGITNGNQILLTKYANRVYKRYALVAGFVEIGETIEETVAREVMEETGLNVKNITYYKSQPWGFDSNLLLGFFCEVDGDTTISRDQEELAVAEWVDRKDVPIYKEGLSLTHEMMQMFYNGKY